MMYQGIWTISSTVKAQQKYILGTIFYLYNFGPPYNQKYEETEFLLPFDSLSLLFAAATRAKHLRRSAMS